MAEIKRILFPVDLSEPSEKIVSYVIRAVQAYKAELHVLYVMRDLDHLSSFYVPYPNITEFQRMVQEGAMRKMKDFCEQHLSDVAPLIVNTRTGDAPREILEYVKEKSIDMIIMGTHGRKGVDKLFFGSVADKIVKQSEVPVMTVNPHTI